MATFRIQRYGLVVCKGDLVYPTTAATPSSWFGGKPPREEPIIVTEQAATNNCYTINHVVLPLPGYDTVYPDNEVGDRYREELALDKIEFRKGAVGESTARGSYRSLVGCATNLSLQLEEDGDSRNVRCHFDLPSGSYATMFLRELMRTTTAANNSM